MQLPNILKTISQTLQKHHAKAIIVGGSVRDHFLKIPSKDYDIEVYGLDTIEQLETILSKFGSVNLVGKSFGVLKFVHEKEEYDFSFPRLEFKVGKGHRGFDVKTDGNMTFNKAALRRDFTINAMGYDIEKKVFLDPFGAQEDIEEHLLRHIDDNSFVEDPLRVYRAVQFCARFGYELAPETKKLCLDMIKEGMLEELPKERIYTEFVKLLLKSSKPSLGFELMRELGILRYFPELEAIISVPQNANVWEHTMQSVDAMVGLFGKDEKQNLKYMFALLCHDFGKAAIIKEDGQIKAIESTKSFMYRLTSEHDLIESILPLVEHCPKPSQFYAAKVTDKAIRKLATKVNIEELVTIAKADFLGRTAQESSHGPYEAGEWLLEKAKALKVQNKPLGNLLQGRDLIALGLEPSPKFTTILDEVYELQMEGRVYTKEDALRYVKKEFLPL